MESSESSQSSRGKKELGTVKKTKTTGLYDDDFVDTLLSRGIYGYPYDGPKNTSKIELSTRRKWKKGQTNLERR